MDVQEIGTIKTCISRYLLHTGTVKGQGSQKLFQCIHNWPGRLIMYFRVEIYLENGIALERHRCFGKQVLSISARLSAWVPTDKLNFSLAPYHCVF